jgi:hypothetical protein
MIKILLRGVAIILVWFLILEFGARLVLNYRINLSFTNPSEHLRDVIYPEVKEIQSNFKFGEDKFNILLLGGSVINKKWSSVEKNIKERVQNYRNKNVEVYNLAMPGHNSLDNLIKYKLLEDYNFDVIIYYENINEARVNNIDSVFFKNDYSHILWYRNIYSIIRHPEMKFTVLPFFFEFVYDRFNVKLNREKYILENLPDLSALERASPSKALPCFELNLEKINHITIRRGARLILSTYAYFVPQGINLNGTKDDRKYYSQCKLSSPVTNWGKIPNTLISLKIHNEMIKSLTERNPEIIFFDFFKEIAPDPVYFCDICHMTNLGSSLLSNGLADKIIEIDQINIF